MRVFAGPNGSGKSTIIKYIQSYKANNRPVEFGYYINADEIVKSLNSKRGLSFKPYNFQIDQEEFVSDALNSGLLNNHFNQKELNESFIISGNSILCLKPKNVDRLAQIIADHLRKKLLRSSKRFSFETVFSHHSKLAIMQEAVNAGYKVYLYFVSTESPEVNKFRVLARVKKGGHPVPEEKIVSRYYRALDLLYQAAQLSYQCYFFDNSEEGKDFKMFAHFKQIAGKKDWDDIDEDNVPNWFRIYYSKKVNK